VGAPDAAVTQQLQQFAAPNNFDVMLFAGPAGAAAITQDDFHVNTFRLCPSVAQYGRGDAEDTTGYMLLSGNSIAQTVDSLSNISVGTQMLTPYVSVDTEANRWLIERHASLFGSQPELYTGCGFATGQALYAALSATGGDPFPDVMIPALENLTIDAPEGTYTIRESDHQASRPLFIVNYAGGTDLDIVQAISSIDSEIACNLPEDLASRCN
ncbi:MAG: ABC transporter substrate-binding protein, partial [Aggregatilineales bacterium]